MVRRAPSRLAALFLAAALVLSCGSPDPLKPPGAPRAVIVTPGPGTSYQGGQTIQYSGNGTDGEGTPLPPGSLSWRIERHHAGQTEEVLGETPGASGSLVIPASGPAAPEDFYRFFLRAVDGSGRADTASRDVPAASVQLTFNTVPSGRQITVDGQPHPSPYTAVTVVGMLTEIGTTTPQSSADTTFTFQGWSDGGAPIHTVSAPSTNATYTATFSVSVPVRLPPVPVIATPAAGTAYRGGQTIQFSGSATDNEGDPIVASSLSWWAEFHHDGAVDQVLPVMSGGSGSFATSATGSVSTSAFYRLYLRAVDDRGLVDTVFRDLQPQVVQITLATSPTGRAVTLDGLPKTAPVTLNAVVGVQRTIGVPSPQTQGSTTFTFQSWSDAGAQSHTIAPPASNTTYTATFSVTTPPRAPPTAVIATPAAGTLYRGGQTIQFSGSATDADGNSVGAGSLTWWAEFHHDGQVDPYLAATSGSAGSLTIASTGSVSTTAFYRLYLSAVDSAGLKDTVFRDLKPQTVQITLATSPTGRTVTLDGQQQTAPITVTTVVGVQRSIGVPSPQVQGTTTFTFQSWSDGGAQTHTISPPTTNTTYSATFSATVPPRLPPTATIATPIAGTTYKGGQSIQFSGSATDADGNSIAAASLRWWAEYRHDGQVDQALAPVSGASGTLPISATGSTSTTAFYRLYLRAVDSAGLVDTVFRDLQPQTVQITLATTPAGRVITLDGQQQTAPFTLTAVVGIQRALNAPSPQVKGDTTFTFASWSDGGTQSHTIAPPASNTTYTATFTVVVPPRNPPTPVIATPVQGTLYLGGQTVQFSGSATDNEGDPIAAASLTWWTEFHHDGQTDPIHALGSGASGSFVVPDTGVLSTTVFYRLYLRAVDDQGLVDTVFRDLQPKTIQLTLASTPAGRTLSLDGQSQAAPIIVTAVTGMKRVLGAPSPQSTPDTNYTFLSWSDGGGATHTIVTPAVNSTFTATFTATAIPPPAATIITPVAGTTYHGGSVIHFSGSAVDGAGAPLTGSSVSWWADFHHDTHTHPFVPVTPGDTGTVTIPTSGEVSPNVFYRFYFRAVDGRGIADTAFRDVLPEKIQLTIASAPLGRTITLDGQPQTAPITVTAVVGLDRQIGAPSPQSSGDSTYTFQSWSDNGSQTHVISTPAVNTTYTASFNATGPANKAPTVTLTAPAAGTSWVINTGVTVSATAADSDGTVQQVQFFDGATSIGSDNSAPFSITWTPAATGTHSLTARATDNSGAFTTSAAVSVTVINAGGGDTQDPTASLISPADGDMNLSGSIIATATASDNVGVVAVEFQLDGVTIGEAPTSPYSLTLGNTSNFATGPHQIRARARDAAGNHSAWQVARVTFSGSDRPAGFSFAQLGGTLDGQGTAMAIAPDGRLFVCDQGGDVRIYKNGTLLSTPFVHVSTTADGERGLLGITFDPQFSSNQFVYVYYTAGTGGTAHNRVSRFTANGDVAVANSESIRIELPQLSSATNHNGGAIHFGADGRLYVAVGDNNTGTNAQSTTSLFGKLLRYNSDGTIPADNPTLGTGPNKAIFAMGLRNPFTFGFQPGSGRLFINDVGESTWEEINEGMSGANYGWPNTEGPTTDPAYNSPLFSYKHGDKPPPPASLVTGEAIVGAAFYNPGTVMFPADYVGDYFFADYVEGWINRLDLAAGNGAVYAFARLPNAVTDLAVGPDGALYALAIDTSGHWGVFRFSR